jgi:hypothetical protein
MTTSGQTNMASTTPHFESFSSWNMTEDEGLSQQERRQIEVIDFL